MSYILDALKRADSERERGAVPGLRTQPLSISKLIPAGRQPTRPLTLAILVATGLVLTGVGWWLWQSQSLPALQPVAMPTAQVATSPPIPTPLAGPRFMAEAGVVRPALTDAVDPAAVPRITTPAGDADTRTAKARQGSAPASEPASIKIPALASKPAITPRAGEGELAKQTAPATATGNDQRMASLSELPADIRLALPKLVISGSTYSDNPAYRMLIINGQVFHEGEKPGVDLQLEQIRPKSAVLNFRGNRYSMAY